MIRTLIRLLILVLILIPVLYLVIFNREETHLVLPTALEVHASLGIIVLTAFSAGILTALVFTLVFGARAYLRERKLLGLEKERHVFFEKMIEARCATALGELTRAKNLWEQLIRRDQTKILARLELAKTLEKKGELREALTVLDEVRVINSQNNEALMKAAEVNRSLNNNTAALDNLHALLSRVQSTKALTLAAEIAEELERYDDAEKFLGQRASLGHNSSEDAARVQFAKITHQLHSRPEELYSALRSFVKSHKEFVPALLELASQEEGKGKLDEAVQLYLKAAKISGSPSVWDKAVRIWLNHNRPERALAVAKSARHDLKGDARAAVELLYCRLFLELNRVEDAEEVLRSFPTQMHSERVEYTSVFHEDLLILSSLISLLKNDPHESLKQLKELDALHGNRLPFQTFTGRGEKIRLDLREAPSPVLSTP